MSETNPLHELNRLGQSVWLDFIRRSWLEDGTIARLVREDGLAGMTSNPAIFEKAIASGREYDEPLARLVRAGEDLPEEIYEALAVEDIRAAADVLLPVYHRTEGRDGFVSLEVSPELANDPDGTLIEARRLHRLVDRPNLMIKVPGTEVCTPVIRTLLVEGISVNITLLFARSAYARVANAYLEAMEERLGKGWKPGAVASVASFFVSRIDSLVDGRLEERSKSADPVTAERLLSLRGRVAIANAKLAYSLFTGLFASPRWQKLAAAGAAPQRLLWASTSTKNPAYRDVLYVEELIGRDTVNTMPPETIDAFRDHGIALPTLGEGVEEAEEVLAELAALGVSLDGATDELLADGIAKFVQPHRKLLAAIGLRSRELAGSVPA
jgi:transaldolase/glucose-6-phosphate isomerase